MLSNVVAFSVTDFNIEVESTIQPILYSSQPIRLKIFWKLAIRVTAVLLKLENCST